MSQVNFPTEGQINTDSKLANFLREFIADNNITKVLETGTWNGCGSTRVLYESLKDADNPKLISFETDKRYFHLASSLYTEIDWIDIIHGSIITPDDFIIAETGEHPLWLAEDIARYNTCGHFDVLDYEFELAFLDSTEFGGFAELKLVENLCKYVVLDDTFTLKHDKSREYCLENHKCIIDDTDDRYGWAVFEMGDK
jgi:hypothetical protein